MRGLGRDEVLERLGGTETVDIVGASRLHEAAELVRWRPDVSENGAFHTDRVTGLVLVAVADAGAWSVIVEPNGFFCTEQSVIAALSRGGEQVTFYLNENTSPAFTWAREGEVLVEFSPDYAASRTGTTPNALDEMLSELASATISATNARSPSWNG